MTLSRKCFTRICFLKLHAQLLCKRISLTGKCSISNNPIGHANLTMINCFMDCLTSLDYYIFIPLANLCI
uniref:Uncharacterized protein n=1 Tax=Oryza brachyantha TaxID=4533 RepID=J3MRY6_ORYBR